MPQTHVHLAFSLHGAFKFPLKHLYLSGLPHRKKIGYEALVPKVLTSNEQQKHARLRCTWNRYQNLVYTGRWRRFAQRVLDSIRWKKLPEQNTKRQVLESWQASRSEQQTALTAISASAGKACSLLHWSMHAALSDPHSLKHLTIFDKSSKRASFLLHRLLLGSGLPATLNAFIAIRKV